MKKVKCGECRFFKYEDADGYGWCELMEEADVHCNDEDCVNCEENEKEDVCYD